MLDQLEIVSDCNALPGLEGAPRGKAVVASWRDQLEGRHETQSESTNRGGDESTGEAHGNKKPALLNQHIQGGLSSGDFPRR